MRRIFQTALITLSVIGFLGLYACGNKRKLAKEASARHQYMQKTYTGLRDSIQEAQVTILNDTIKVLFPENVLFDHGSPDIYKETYPIMNRFANALNTYNKTAILINGYTDNTGTDAINEKLSADRAKNAKSLLTQYNVDSTRMLTWGRASSNPIADNSTPEGRAKNRRVEFIVLYKMTVKE